MLNLQTHIAQLHHWMLVELNIQVQELRARCASLANADLPAETQEDAAIISEAALTFEQIVHDVPTQSVPAIGILRQHAHDLRNPLSAIIGFSQYMRDATGHPSAAAVYRAANATLFTIDSLTYYAQAKSEDLNTPLHAVHFDLIQLADKLAQQAPLEMMLPDGNLDILADRNQMEQVILTLAQTANNIATDKALLVLQPDTDGYVHLTFRFPSAVDIASLAACFHPDWVAIPGETRVWEIGLCGVLPIVEGHRGHFEIVAVGHEVQFALALPINVKDALNSRPM